MQVERFDYKVLLELSFTPEEVEIMLEAAESHYDPKYKKEVTLLLYWMTTEIAEADKELDSVTGTFSFQQIDTLCKVVGLREVVRDPERASIGLGLRLDLKRALDTINEEAERLNASYPERD
jgi:hypothetical protein